MGLYVSQQSINIADSPKAAFVHITLADPLSRYLRRMCVGCTILSWSVRDDTSATKNQRKRERSDRKHGILQILRPNNRVCKIFVSYKWQDFTDSKKLTELD